MECLSFINPMKCFQILLHLYILLLTFWFCIIRSSHMKYMYFMVYNFIFIFSITSSIWSSAWVTSTNISSGLSKLFKCLYKLLFLVYVGLILDFVLNIAFFLLCLYVCIFISLEPCRKYSRPVCKVHNSRENLHFLFSYI